MNRLITGLVLAAVAVFASPASAQETVGDLLKRGVKPMAADELKAFLPGSTYTAPRSVATAGGGDPLILELAPDGKANGTRAQNSMAGDWKVDEAGRFCYSVSPAVSRGRRMPSESCHFVFKADDRYYQASSVDDRDARLTKVEFRR